MLNTSLLEDSHFSFKVVNLIFKSLRHIILIDIFEGGLRLPIGGDSYLSGFGYFFVNILFLFTFLPCFQFLELALETMDNLLFVLYKLLVVRIRIPSFGDVDEAEGLLNKLVEQLLPTSGVKLILSFNFLDRKFIDVRVIGGYRRLQ